MNIEDFFQPINVPKCPSGQLGNKLSDDWQKSDIVIFDFLSLHTQNEISLAQLPLWTYAVTEDCPEIFLTGGFIPGKTSEDTAEAVRNLMLTALSQGKKVLWAGGDLMTMAQTLPAIAECYGKVLPAVLDAKIDLTNAQGNITAGAWNQIFLQSEVENPLCLGVQQYLNDPVVLHVFQELGGEVVRLSDVLNPISEAEVYVRNKNVINISARALAMAYRDSYGVNPNGFSPRESCQIVKDVAAFGKTDIIAFTDLHSTDFFINEHYLSQLLWHGLDGFSIRLSHPEESEQEKYHVILENQPYTFIREVFQDRWWVSIDDKNVLPCSKFDFQTAKSGMLSPRIKNLR